MMVSLDEALTHARVTGVGVGRCGGGSNSNAELEKKTYSGGVSYRTLSVFTIGRVLPQGLLLQGA